MLLIWFVQFFISCILYFIRFCTLLHISFITNCLISCSNCMLISFSSFLLYFHVLILPVNYYLFHLFISFLVADAQLYKRLCLSVHPSIHPSYHPSIYWSIDPWALVEKWKNNRFRCLLCNSVGGVDRGWPLLRPCPPVRNDTVTPRRLLIFSCCQC